MQEISESRFKTHCLSILEQVRKTNQPVRITRYGKPVAEVVPVGSADRRHHPESSTATEDLSHAGVSD